MNISSNNLTGKIKISDTFISNNPTFSKKGDTYTLSFINLKGVKSFSTFNFKTSGDDRFKYLTAQYRISRDAKSWTTWYTLDENIKNFPPFDSKYDMFVDVKWTREGNSNIGTIALLSYELNGSLSRTISNEAKSFLSNPTLAAESNCNTSTTPSRNGNITLRVEGPQGATGPQGIKGPQGNIGVTGPQGGSGPQGATGPQGFAINSFYGTSSTFLTIPDIGNIVYLDTQSNLAYTANQYVLVANDYSNPYVEDYNNDGISGQFYGLIDSYNPITGSMSIVINSATGIGLTFASWYINLSGTMPINTGYTGIVTISGVTLTYQNGLLMSVS